MQPNVDAAVLIFLSRAITPTATPSRVTGSPRSPYGAGFASVGPLLISTWPALRSPPPHLAVNAPAVRIPHPQLDIPALSDLATVSHLVVSFEMGELSHDVHVRQCERR